MKCRLGAFAAMTALAWAGSPGQSDLDRARALASHGSSQAAIQAYRIATQKDPSLTPAWRELALCLHAAGEQREASRILDSLLAVDGQDVANLNAAGEVKLASGDPHGAQACFRKSLAKRPDQPRIHIRLGEALEGAGDVEPAVHQYRLATQNRKGTVAPETALSARIHLSQALSKLGKVQEAIRILQATRVLKSPGNPARLQHALCLAHQAFGDSLFKAERFEEAAAAYQEAARTEPDHPSPRVALGWALRKAGKAAEALEAWNQAMELASPPSIPLLRALAELHYDEGRLEQAQALYAQAHQRAPQEPQPCFQLFDIALSRKDPSRRDQALKDLLAIPELPTEWLIRVAESFSAHEEMNAGMAFFQKILQQPGASAGLARLHTRKASLLSAAGQQDDAIASYHVALQVDPLCRAALRDLGWTQAKVGRWKDCQRTWQTYVDRYPKEAEPYDLLGEAQMHNGDTRGAIESERMALHLDPSGLTSRLRLLRSLAQDGHMTEALALARKLGRELPDDIRVQARLAEIETRFQHHSEAQNTWAKVIQMSPGDERARANWIRETYALGDYDQALKEAQKQTALHPAPLSSLVLLSQDAQARDDLQEAARHFHRIVEDYPHMIEAWIVLGGILHRMGRLDDALKMAEEALRANPNNPDILIFQAECMVEAGRFQEGLRQFQALREHPGNRLVFRGLYYALIANQQFKEAQQLLTGTIHESFLNGPEASYWHAEVLGGLGRYQEAQSTLAQLLKPAVGIRHIPILLYHGILPGGRTIAITAEQFELHMRALAGAGYTAITLTELTAMMAGRKPWPVKPILLTFDDARTDSFAHADPVLAKYGLKATMFVPTALPAVQGDLFQASWASLKTYGSNGRWDMQAHGFHAHEPIPIDAIGTQGRFLTSRLWLQEENRHETPGEFKKRLEEDYQNCGAMLRGGIPNCNPVGFAFPFSEAGQINVSNREDATAVNDGIWRRYFRFGMVQDSTGYNAIRTGETETRLLWRFEPEGNWSGERLLSHLASQEPKNYARLQSARLELWSGHPRKARQALLNLQAEIPALRRECQIALAEVAWSEDRPRHVEACLKEAASLGGQPSLTAIRLTSRAAWTTRPSVAGSLEFSQDSDHRESRSQKAIYRQTLGSFDLEAGIGHIAFAERGQATLQGEEFRLQVNRDFTEDADGSAWIRQRNLSGSDECWSGGAQFAFHGEQHSFSLSGEHGQIDANRALAAGITRNIAMATYSLQRDNLRGSLSQSLAWISDGNREDITRATLMVQPEGLRGWRFGGELVRDASLFSATEYHSPNLFRSVLGRTEYQATFIDDSSFRAFGAFGGGTDAESGFRWVGSVGITWIQYLTTSLRLQMSFQADSSVGYSAQQGSLSLQYHF